MDFNDKMVKLEFGKVYAWALFIYGIVIAILQLIQSVMMTQKVAKSAQGKKLSPLVYSAILLASPILQFVLMFPVMAVHSLVFYLFCKVSFLVPHIAVDDDPNGKYIDSRVFIISNVIWNIGIPLLFIIIRK